MLILELCYLFYRCYWATGYWYCYWCSRCCSCCLWGWYCCCYRYHWCCYDRFWCCFRCYSYIIMLHQFHLMFDGSWRYSSFSATLLLQQVLKPLMTLLQLLILYFYICNVIVAEEVSHKRQTKRVYSNIIYGVSSLDVKPVCSHNPQSENEKKSLIVVFDLLLIRHIMHLNPFLFQQRNTRKDDIKLYSLFQSTAHSPKQSRDELM